MLNPGFKIILRNLDIKSWMKRKYYCFPRKHNFVSNDEEDIPVDSESGQIHEHTWTGLNAATL